MPDPTLGFQPLVEWGLLTADQLLAAGQIAGSRGVEVERVLRYDFCLTRRKLLEALAAYHHCRWTEYDERLPVPPDLLRGLDPQALCAALWFPVAKDGPTVTIAARDPDDPVLPAEVRKFINAEKFEYRVALTEDIAAFIEDFLNGDPAYLKGNERTGLAYWRNTMSRWRTQLACYRTDFAGVRTHLSLLRGGLMLVAIGRILLHSGKVPTALPVGPAFVVAGCSLMIFGLTSYHRVKTSLFRPPRHQTLVEVTSASLHFLENYRFVDSSEPAGEKQTMLARLAEIVNRTSISIESSHDNKARSQPAHERNLLAAQRTVAACYRTIYARARTGLSFMRTGASFVGLGLGLITYFGLSPLTILDSLVIAAGTAILVDGLIWYWPVRKENCEASKCTADL